MLCLGILLLLLLQVPTLPLGLEAARRAPAQVDMPVTRNEGPTDKRGFAIIESIVVRGCLERSRGSEDGSRCTFQAECVATWEHIEPPH